jgi:hypothetical protein
MVWKIQMARETEMGKEMERGGDRENRIER